jgi:tetratricopeptide (TPR) repeat protein
MSARGRSADEREVVPRWRDFRTTVMTGELASTVGGVPIDAKDEIARLRSEFADNPDIFFAADYFGALVAARESGTETDRVRQFVIDNSEESSLLRRVATDSVEEEPTPLDQDLNDVQLIDGAQHRVSARRRALRRHPRNPVGWVDLALSMATLGNAAQSRKAMLAALGLAPDSRFVLRSAARLFVHLDEPETAHYFLARSSRTNLDPWLLAADMATSKLAFETIGSDRRARELLISDQFSATALSELASELGSEELRSGNDKRGRRLFQQALIEPTENAVAQAASLAERLGLEVPANHLEISRGFEARAITVAREGEWSAAVVQARQWHLDQPFALEPAIFGSYAAGLGANDHESAIQIASAGLRIHPTDPILNNNAAFALAHLDRVDEAERHIRHAPDSGSDENSAIYRATRGLIAFRAGRITEARDLYQSAITDLAEIGRREQAAMAVAMWALEEQRLESPVAHEVFELVERLAGTDDSPELETLRQRYVDRAANARAADSSSIKLSKWTGPFGV